MISTSTNKQPMITITRTNQIFQNGVPITAELMHKQLHASYQRFKRTSSGKRMFSRTGKQLAVEESELPTLTDHHEPEPTEASP